jgi:hypothetical protein
MQKVKRGAKAKKKIEQGKQTKQKNSCRDFSIGKNIS